LPRAGLSQPAVVDAAAELADSAGVDAVTLSGLADRLGVRTPSLYNHVDGLPGLRRLLTLKALRELEATVRAAVGARTGEDAIAAVCHAYRSWARARPGLYACVVPTTEVADEDIRQAGASLLRFVVNLFSSFGLEGDAALHATRCVRAAVHGFAMLEVAGGFGLGLDLDETYDRLVSLLVAGLRAG
jgi:AcrR family transcriptional regulator